MSNLNENTSMQSVVKTAQTKCRHCRQVLFTGNIQYVEIECPKCHKLQKFGRKINNICIKN